MRWGIRVYHQYILFYMVNKVSFLLFSYEKKKKKIDKLINIKYIKMNEFRYQLERYRGRGSRYVCPQCGRKYVFTRYVDTHNNNQYVSDKVGKCNR